MGSDADRFAHYARLSGTTGDLHCELDPDGTIQYASPGFREAVGTPDDEMTGRSFLDGVHPDDRDEVRSRLAGLAAKPTAASIRFRMVPRRDRIPVIDCRVGPLVLEDGRLRFVASGRDVTDDDARERALREREEAARLLLDHSTDVLWIMDKDLKTRCMSRSVQMQLGYTPEEYMALPLDQRMPSESVAVVKQRLAEEFPIALEKARRQEPHHYTFEVLHRRRDGRLGWGEINVSFLYDDQWRITGFHGVTRNIDDRKRMEAELAATRERYRQLFEHLLSGCVIVRPVRDADGTATDLFCETVNPAFERQSGISRDRVEGRPMSDVFGRYDRFWLELFDRVGRTGTPERVDRFMVQAGRHFEGVLFALDDDRVVGLFDDVTQRRRMEVEMLRVQRLESVGVLAGGIAHDFNNILTGILGNISLCRDIVDDPASEAGGLLLAAEKACGRARDLTQQLLTFSRGGGPIKQDAFLPELVRETAEFVLSGSNVRATFDFAEDVGRVEVDRGQFARVVHNLVLNAVQAMPEGGAVEIAARRVSLADGEFAALGAGEYVRLSIRDEGPGIPAKDLGRVFDPYFSTRRDGTGLGLSVANSIVRKHDGFLGVESESGHGTTFTILLPARCGRGGAVVGAGGDARVTGIGRVLVMDDDADVREVLARMLRALGYEAQLTHDGEQALAAYRDLREAGEPVLAVIMDLTVPGGMGGREAMRELLRLDPGVRGIVISGYSNDPVMSRPRDFGFCDVIPKPVGLAGLREALARIEASRT